MLEFPVGSKQRPDQRSHKVLQPFARFEIALMVYCMLVLPMCDVVVLPVQRLEDARNSECTPLLLGTWNNGCGRAQVRRAYLLRSIATVITSLHCRSFQLHPD